jgi:hypothetical protein
MNDAADFIEVASAAPRNELSLPGSLVHGWMRVLVDVAEGVRVYETPGQETTLLEIQVAQGDYGRAIGKEGQHITSLRAILLSIGVRQRRPYELRMMARQSDDVKRVRTETPVELVAGLLEGTVKALVSMPGQVNVDLICGNQVIIFEIRAAPDDNRLIIGAQGRLINSLRHLVAAVGDKIGKRILIEVVDVARGAP